ncbi:jacalin-related lectin 33 isoform X1 [Capsella rubella]|uniref:jacalin-related lectin 33 isoform X1 n=2 Tax=Capsella rubella TaxID=81985 RepID=UPI000CD5A2B7|nr:jacalin-related lectin 33 isoform X1 [Capsella rubella]
MAQKVEAQGGKGGNQWDDGSEHDAVTKIQAAAGANGMHYVKFDYVKNGKTEEAPLRGVKGRSIASDPFVINHPEEYLVSVEGWYHPEGLMIQGLKFKSNKKTSDVIGYEDGTPFTLQVQDKKIIGFHGFATDYVQSLGAYFAPLITSSTPLTPAVKQEAGGGTGGASWDDGVHDGVSKVHVGQGQDGVSSINIVYKKGSQEVEGGEHGKKTLLGFETFEVDANDYIIAVQVTHDKVYGQDSDIITSLTFYTFKGKTSPPYGMETEKKFLLKDKNGGKLVGFHGRAGEALHALGAYFAATTTIPSTTSPKKLLGIGGEKGTAWDDGAYDGVKKVYVGQAQDGISVVKFVYDKGAQDIVGGEHGKSTLLGFEEFEIDYPSEYITAVEGTYDKIFGSDDVVITMLKFKTNKQTSSPFGLEAGTAFALKEEGHKIVGFHGKVSDLLHQFGVHVMPITN